MDIPNVPLIVFKALMKSALKGDWFSILLLLIIIISAIGSIIATIYFYKKIKEKSPKFLILYIIMLPIILPLLFIIGMRFFALPYPKSDSNSTSAIKSREQWRFFATLTFILALLALLISKMFS